MEHLVRIHGIGDEAVAEKAMMEEEVDITTVVVEDMEVDWE